MLSNQINHDVFSSTVYTAVKEGLNIITFEHQGILLQYSYLDDSVLHIETCRATE